MIFVNYSLTVIKMFVRPNKDNSDFISIMITISVPKTIINYNHSYNDIGLGLLRKSIKITLTITKTKVTETKIDRYFR